VTSADVDHHLYSVPHPLVHSVVEACLTAALVEIFHRGQRVGLHVRSPQRGGCTTVLEHMPKAHRAHLEWTPTRLIHWAGTIAPAVAALAAAILDGRPHSEQSYRSCQGLMRLAKQYGPERLDAAYAPALAAGARSYKHVDSILKHGPDRLPLDAPAPPPLPRSHETIRGAAYYQASRPEDAPC
jgi:transposase